MLNFKKEIVEDLLKITILELCFLKPCSVVKNTSLKHLLFHIDQHFVF